MAPVSGCLVIMCGVPCSGKSTAAAELASALSAKGIRTTTVDEPSLHLHRNAGYANGHVEKNTRGLLKATVDRSLHKDGPVVIVDACNGIKGYRYELWCIARQVGARSCVVHCDTPEDDARAWNETRRASSTSTGGEGSGDTAGTAGTKPEEWGGWDAKIFDDLAFRFERPDGKNRWDAPLFTIRPPLKLPVHSAPGSLNDDVVEMHGYRDATREETMERCVAHVSGETEGSALHSRALEPNAATQPSTLLSDTRLRAEIDAGAQDVVEVLTAVGGGGGDGGNGVCSFGEGCPELRLKGVALNLQTLRRLKRTFLKLAANGMARTSAAGDVRGNIKRMFVEYIQQHVDSKQ